MTDSYFTRTDHEDDVQGYLGPLLVVCGGPLIGVIASLITVEQPKQGSGSEQRPVQPIR